MIKRYYTRVFLLFTLSMVANLSLYSQVEKVVVEVYYVSDANDATNTIGGILEEGSVTYRIFADLEEGYSLISIFGEDAFPLSVKSTESFYNNTDRPEIFGFERSPRHLDENVVALDSWISLGFATRDHFGVPKESDTDGSMVGGENNDGGSEEIASGLLINNSTEMGLPLTQADGIIEADSVPSDFFSIGIVDTSIFGSVTIKELFLRDALLQSNTGVVGPDSDNILLLAQLTTKGELEFNLNLELMSPEGDRIKMVAWDTLQSAEVKYSNWLSYPFQGGCTDPYFAEYDPAAVMDDGSCRDSMILGCTDSEACNYDPEANFNIQELCCYGPDNCDNRDISVVCPDYKKSGNLDFEVYPNPTGYYLNIDLSSQSEEDAVVYIFDSFGNQWINKNLGNIKHSYEHQIDVGSLKPGMYMIRVFTGEGSASRLFIKE
jgi:hypothetical protein